MRGLRFAVPLILLLNVLSSNAAAQETQSRTLPSAPMASTRESVQTGVVSPEPIPLKLVDAIHRGLKSNLAVITGDLDSRRAEAARLRDLSELRPKIDGRVSALSQQVNLAAFGFAGFSGVPQVIGPFPVFDARAYLSQPLIDTQRRHNLREATENKNAVEYSNGDTREAVVLTVMDLYFRAVTAQSRVHAVEAQVKTAETLNVRAGDLKNAGVAPGIDVLRSQVQLQTEQQRLIQARNEFSRVKLELARAIGLPLAQEFMLADALPAGELPSESLQELLDRAYAIRPDAKAAEARLHAAEEAVKAARAENLPTVHLNANYGAIGSRPENSHGTYLVEGAIQFPIFNSSSKDKVMDKEALLNQRQAEMDSLHGGIELDVRSALLQMQSSEEQYKVAQSALNLVRQQLEQAQDRFAAGVANNLEVVQAQESLALADENVISSLYAFNVSRAMLAHAAGVAEKSVEALFGGTK
jgi:outer membrane protein TolC